MISEERNPTAQRSRHRVHRPCLGLLLASRLKGSLVAELTLPSAQLDIRGARQANPAHIAGFKILGPVGVRCNGRDLLLGGAKQLTVLAALLMANERVVHDSRLIALLWGADPPKTVDAQLCTYVSRLRNSLPDSTEFFRRGQGYSMITRNASFDYEEFCYFSDVGISAFNAANYRAAASYLREALMLWRGPPLVNTTVFFADEQVAGLEERRLTALEFRIEADLALGRHARLLAELYTLTAQYPLREMFRDQLLRALFRCGRQGDAIEIYHEGRRLLAEELGVDPDITLQQTFQAIIMGDRGLRYG